MGPAHRRCCGKLRLGYALSILVNWMTSDRRHDRLDRSSKSLTISKYSIHSFSENTAQRLGLFAQAKLRLKYLISALLRVSLLSRHHQEIRSARICAVQVKLEKFFIPWVALFSYFIGNNKSSCGPSSVLLHTLR